MDKMGFGPYRFSGRKVATLDRRHLPRVFFILPINADGWLTLSLKTCNP
jgi:hypothetical protein